MQKMDHRGQIKQPITYFLRRRQQNLPSYKSNIQTSYIFYFYKKENSSKHSSYAKAKQMTWSKVFSQNVFGARSCNSTS